MSPGGIWIRLSLSWFNHSNLSDKLCVLFNILSYDELKSEPKKKNKKKILGSGICPGAYLV
jgi:hypothetical protein